MKPLIFKMLALTALLAATGLPAAAEDLDSALAAQKKKAQHRVYSEQAQLADQNFMIPRTESEEERLLDKKLREMDAKLDARPPMNAMSATPRTVTVVPRTTEDQNWLTTAVMDDLASTSITNDRDDSWISRELARQKENREQEALLRENAKVEQLLNNSTDQQQSLPVLDSLKKYQLTQPDILGGVNRDDAAPSYMTPQSGTPDPLSAVHWSRKKETPAAPALFSPEAARLAASPEQNPLRPAWSAPTTLNPGIPERKSSSVFSYDRRDDSTPAPLSPIEMIKKSSPINRANPFDDNRMPEFKTSIWQ